MLNNDRDLAPGWHAGVDDLARWVAGTLDEARAWSIEAHVPGCATCRGRLAPLVDGPRLEAGRRRLLAELDAPVPGLVERVLGRLGAPAHLARLVVVTPALRGSWLVGLCLTLAVSVGLAQAASAGTRPWHGTLVFLTLAPLLPLAGVALAFGPRGDPTYPVALAAPFPWFRLVLLRSLAVTATSVLLVAVGAALLPHVAWGMAALLPSLALVAIALALSTAVSPALSTGIPIAAWLAALWGPVAASDGKALVVAHPGLQVVAVVVLALAAGSWWARRQHLEGRPASARGEAGSR
ncbi:MAG: zf-HC2 domain-containing protein [Acidimicrobiales bacterium]